MSCRKIASLVRREGGLDLQAISFGDFSLGQQRKVTRSPKADGSSASSRQAKGGTCPPQVSEPDPATALLRRYSQEKSTLTPVFLFFRTPLLVPIKWGLPVQGFPYWLLTRMNFFRQLRRLKLLIKKILTSPVRMLVQ